MRPNGNGRGRFADYMMRGGTGPLMVAALTYDEEAIKALLAHGAEVDLPNVFQITPLMAAAGMSGSSRGGVGSAIPGGPGRKQDDIQDRAIQTIDLLLDAGANINARVIDSHTRTAKLVAYIQGRDHEGKTALFAAAEAGWDKVVKHLLDRGADPAVRDASNKTALDYARSGPPPGPGSPPKESEPAAARRAATVALLEAAVPKSAAVSGNATAAK
jgi:ankyrin repeat protein